MNEKERKNTHLDNPSFIDFVPVNDSTVEHHFATLKQQGRGGSKVGARSTSIFNFKLDRFTELK